MRDRNRYYSFTLIELLVVIAITAILASLLLTSLARAKYRAREVICMNNMKQQAIGVLMYTTDCDEYYPGVRYLNHSRADWQAIRLAWPHVNTLNSQLADYWSAEAVSFENEGTITDDPLNLKPNIWMPDPRYIDTNYLQYYGLQEFVVNTDPTDKANWRGTSMRKVDSYFTSQHNTTHARPKIKVLISDALNRWYEHPQKRSVASHTNMDRFWTTPSKSRGFLNWAHETPYYSGIHPRMSGHFCAQDGSIQKYTIPAYTYDGFVKYRTYYQVIPEELTEE